MKRENTAKLDNKQNSESYAALEVRVPYGHFGFEIPLGDRESGRGCLEDRHRVREEARLNLIIKFQILKCYFFNYNTSMKNVAILGASTNQNRMSHKAQLLLRPASESIFLDKTSIYY